MLGLKSFVATALYKDLKFGLWFTLYLSVSMSREIKRVRDNLNQLSASLYIAVRYLTQNMYI